jgi:phospholipid-binding lipoprotein MlaA
MKLKTWLKWILFSVTFVVCGGVFASNPDDPLEPVNRVIFKFNDAFDTVFFRPVALLYNKIVPKPIATGIFNIYRNIDNVPTVLNDLLQLNLYQATSDAWRLGINTTIGLGGFFDVASQIGLEPNYEDFGLTLARWGYTKSMYIQIPFFGPGTIRDSSGYLVDYYYLSIYPYIQPLRDQYALYFFGVLVRRADLLRYEDFMQEAAIDKYVFMRDAYLQHRNYLIERNKQLGDPYLNKNKLEETAS